MVLNKRDLDKAFSPGKARKIGKKVIAGGGSSLKPSTSGSTDGVRSDNGSAATSIRVIVRVRPPNEKESQKDNHRSIIKVIDNKMLIFDPKEEESPFFYRGVAQKGRDLLKKQNKELEFMFDRVFDDSCTNDEVFQGTTKDIIASLLDGYNCSVFAYGATGAGKTHTMLGNDIDPGITFKTMAELFAQIQAQSEDRDFNLGVTYLEVYNENVCDLLHKSGPLAIRDDGRHGIIIAGLKIITIHSPDELLTLLARGNKNRTQHPTDANEESSRSHAVFQVYVNITNKLDGQKKHVKLSMIDLAGSERASATGCKGARFKEGANINKSLLALGNCINNLADGIKHIPYRDSKLTRLLKDSLGGNCQTVMIANVGPSSLSFEDTYNTLRYANRAKKIKLNVKKNIISCQMHVTGYVKMVEEQKKEIEMLKQKLLALESNSTGVNVTVVSPDSSAPKDPRIEEIEKEFVEIRDKMIQLIGSKMQLNEKILSLQSADKILCCRIQYKIAADKRLRNLTAAVDAMSQEEQNASGKSRVNKSLSHFKRQRDVVKLQMESAWNDLQSIEMQIAALNVTLESKKYAEKFIENNELQQCKIDKIRYQQQYEHAKKVSSLQQCEMQSIDTIVRTMSSTLQNYYNLMRGYGTLTDKMKQEFKQLVKSLEGVRNIKWAESETDKYSPEDSYVLTCLSTEELDDPLNSEMPIYRATYLEDEETSQYHPRPKDSTILLNGNDTPPQGCSEMSVGTPPPTVSLNSTITLDETAAPSSEETNDESMPPSHADTTADAIKANQLNNTFNLIENKLAKKRTLADKNQTGNHTPVKQAKKISPKQRTMTNGNSGVLSSGKENKNCPVIGTKKPASVMSAKSIAILNKLKADRPKLLPQLTNSTSESGTGDGSLCNKVVRVKERRGIAGSHPYQKVNAKPKTFSSAPSSRVPW